MNAVGIFSEVIGRIVGLVFNIKFFVFIIIPCLMLGVLIFGCLSVGTYSLLK